MKILIVLVSLVAASLTSALTSSPAREGEMVRQQGAVSAWQLNMDGVLFLRIEGVDPARKDSDEVAEERELWFRSPPDRSAVISVEEMLLEIVLNREGAHDFPALTVSGEHDRESDGSTREQAISIVSIGVL